MARSLVLLSLLSLLVSVALAGLTTIEHSLKEDGSLAILVVGDWGRKGTYNQSLVAQQMGKVGKGLDIDFVISTGDNFYEDGLTGLDDEAFEQSFSEIYTADSLQKPWYTVLGNHDYRGDVIAQLSPVLQMVDCRFICMRSFIVNAEIVDFFFVDTTPFVVKYWTKPKDHHYDWRDVAPRETYIANLLQDLEYSLKASSARWKIVVGHHTMRSVSKHGDTEELLQYLLPVLKTNGVDFYINGHDHCLEHISSTDSPLQYFTSGGGSKAWRGVYTSNADKVQFFYDGQGFMSLKLTECHVDITFYDVEGQELYKWSMAKINRGAFPSSVSVEAERAETTT
ncbi:Purple acid phosphatase [Rhynchospora pubera]|uniref:Purple acid phosphatase n=1 Tax=Rhynchospora pubera TaxID=906938 RepID=A0AAV8HFC7_9POAL|nr:Purple acid phosphatase [Rhynchospora pubera]